MRFPVLLVTPPPSGEDYYEIKEGHPVTASRAIHPNATPPREQGQPKGGQQSGRQDAPRQELPQPYQGQERRVQCRRIAQQPILLDTRSVRDRRGPDHSGGGTGAGVDEVA